MRTVSWGIVIFLSFIPFSHSAQALDRDKPSAEAAGEVVSVKGKVFVRTDGDAAGAASMPVAIRPAQNIFPGDVINTGSDGSIKILLKDKSVVDLGQSSLFKVDGFKSKTGADREVDLDMKFGRLRVAVSKKISGDGKFNVKTKAATMGVRGTEFVVDSPLGADKNSTANGPKTDVTVLQGKVDVKAPTGVGALAGSHVNSLLAGGHLSAQTGAAPLVKTLNPIEMKTLSTSSKLSDNTFMKAITIEPKSDSGSNRSPASSGSGGGAPSSIASVGSLQSAVASMAASAPAVPVSFSEIGVPGAPSVVNIATAPVNQVNRSYTVTVVVH